MEGKYKIDFKLVSFWKHQRSDGVQEAKGEDEQLVSCICIRDMLKHTKELFTPFLETQNKAVSLRQGNRTLCQTVFLF